MLHRLVAAPPVDGGWCGVDCPCCEYTDGTAPVDHARDCALITLADGEFSDCTCDGAEARARDRKRVRLMTDCTCGGE